MWSESMMMPCPLLASPTVGPASVVTSLAVFTILYGVLAVVELMLTIRYARAGAPPSPAPVEDDDEAGRPLTFAY